jgi:two-component system, OmpR family, sensor histidine kinase KdpD
VKSKIGVIPQVLGTRAKINEQEEWMVYHTPGATRKISDWLSQYILAVATTAFTILVLVTLRQVLSSATIALVFLLPVGLSTALWGLGPGFASGLCSFFAINYFFIFPYYTLQVHQTQDLLVLVIFLFVAVIINQLVGRVQASLEQARARERETTWLYELGSALARLSEDKAIAHTLALQAQLTLRADWVQVSLEPGQDDESIVVSTPEHAILQDEKPTLLLPLQTARGLLGEIGLWRGEPPVTDAEARLLGAFASQGAVAIDRARLAQADRRARILEESDRLKSALLSSVSHELRTPLATIKAAVTSLRSDDFTLDGDARKDLLAVIEEETDSLNSLVGNLLDMSRIEAGAVNPQRKWNILAEIASSVVNRMKTTAQGYRIVNHISYDLPLVPVDWMQIERVFSNLISNSIKYSPDNSEIRIEAEVKEERSILVQVINQGPPVLEEHLDRIFDKFYRITAADRVTGTGLGLSICKGFIEAHGGRIWAENLPGGFAFKFILPLSWEGSGPRLPAEST